MERSRKTVTLPPPQDLFSVQSVSSDFLPRISAYFLCERLFQGQEYTTAVTILRLRIWGLHEASNDWSLGDPSPSLG